MARIFFTHPSELSQCHFIQGEPKSNQPRPFAFEREWDTQSASAQKQKIQKSTESWKPLPDGLEKDWRTGNGKLPSTSILSGYAASMETDTSKVNKYPHPKRKVRFFR